MDRGLSSFDIYVIVFELKGLIGGYIEKIYQLTREELLIRLNDKRKGIKENIYVRNGELLCTTQKKFVAPTKPSTFAMTLRKHLLNGRIIKITQHEFDRIIKIDIKKKEGNYTLVIELFSNGNIIIVNPESKIILPLIKHKWAHRTLRPNEEYLPPPSQINPFNLTLQDFIDLIKKSKKDLVRTLAVYVNLGGVYAEEICFRANIDKNSEITKLSEDSLKKIFDELQKFLRIFKEKRFQPTFMTKDGKTIDILPLPFESYIDCKFVKTDNFTQGLQEFIDVKKIVKKEVSVQEKNLQKLKRKLFQQQKTIEDFKKKSAQKKIEGDTIYLNFQTCQKLLQDIALLLEKKDKMEEIEDINKKNIVKNFDPVTNELIILIEDNKEKTMEVKLDFRKTVAENAEKAYRDSKKFQDKIKGALEALKITQKEIFRLEKSISLEQTEKHIEKEKRFWFENFRWFISSDGNLIIAGKDAKTNERIVKKYLKEGDRYVHADLHGAPSCVVKSTDLNDNKILISENTLKEACVFAASYSKAWKQFSEAHVYWVLPEQVSKTPQSGEFLPKGAFVIRGKRNYHKCTIEAAVGLIEINGLNKVMGGPVDSVKARSSKYVVLKPGLMKKSVISKKLSKIFQISIESIERVLPPGDVTIVKTEGFIIK